MLDQHAAFRQELHLAARFFHKVNKHRDQTPDVGGGPGENEHILQHVSLAFEDIPEDMHESVRTLLMHPTEDKSLREQVIDVAKNAAGGAWGDIEQVTNQLICLHILSHLGHHVPYTYRVDSKVIRGSRPTPDKLQRLNAGGCEATVNLCKEMDNGDADLIDAAGLTGTMMTKHIEITDNTPPTHDQVDDLIAYLGAVTERSTFIARPGWAGQASWWPVTGCTRDGHWPTPCAKPNSSAVRCRTSWHSSKVERQP
jgi:hypothetical protein